MTIEQCYEQLHGDYAQVIQRLPSPALVERFLGKFLDDGSFSELTSAMAAGQTEAAFRAAHTLKGVSANLGFERLDGVPAGQGRACARRGASPYGAGAPGLSDDCRCNSGISGGAVLSGGFPDREIDG